MPIVQQIPVQLYLHVATVTRSDSMCLNPSPRTGRSVVTTKHSQTELLNVKNVITNVDKARDGGGGVNTTEYEECTYSCLSFNNVQY